MKKLIILILFTALAFNVFAQEEDVTHDPKAKEILDKLSAKFDKYETVRIFFQYSAKSKADSTSSEKFDGYLFAKGEDKYKLIIPGSETFSDGKKLWVYSKNVAEINVTHVNPDDNNILTPYKLLTIYKTGYKYRLKAEVKFDVKVKKDGKITTETKEMYIIDLYPEKIANAEYSIIRLWIDKKKTELVSVKYFGKNGIDYVIDFLEISPNIVINDKIFTFERSRYPKDVEVIDFTEE